MAIKVVKVDYQLQLTDQVKSTYPNSPVVLLNIQDLANVPALVGGKFLKINAAGTSIELADSTGNVTGNLPSGTSFPGSPTANQLFLLTRQAGNNPIGIYQRNAANNDWLLRVSSVPTANTISTIFGVTAKKSAVDNSASSEANAKSEAGTAFDNANSRTTKNIDLLSGGLFRVTFPAPTGYYRPYVAIPTSAIGSQEVLRIYSGDSDNETANWVSIAKTLNAVDYTVYTNLYESAQAEVKEWLFKKYS